MNTLLKKILDSGIVEDENGNQFQLHSHTSLKQGIFLQEILEKIMPVKGVEVGLAYGVSSLFILDKMQELKGDGYKHIVIEPFPEGWNHVGATNIQKAGFTDYVEIKKALSDQVLPQMYLDNENIQFAYIDSTKLFDVIFHDFYFIDKILDIGGVIVFDDCTFPGIRKVVRFIANHPSYKILGALNEDFKTTKFSMVEKIITTVINLLPFKKRVYPTTSFKTDKSLGINYFCIAFQKIKDDNRSFYWNENF